MEATFPLEFPGTFDGLYGLVIDSLDVEAGEVRAHVDVQPHHLQQTGIVHGGVYASIAESSTSVATNVALADERKIAFGMSNQTSFVRPIAEGTVHAVGRARHRGRTTWVWEVEISDDSGRLCALVRVTVAVRRGAAGVTQ